MATAAEPKEMVRRTQEEGRRRLSRPPLDLAAAALVAGLDVVARSREARGADGGRE